MHLQDVSSTRRPGSAVATGQRLSQTFCRHHNPAAQAALCQAGSRGSSLSQAAHGDTATASVFSAQQSRRRSSARFAQAAPNAVGSGSVSRHRRSTRLTQVPRDSGWEVLRCANSGAAQPGGAYRRSARLLPHASSDAAEQTVDVTRSGDVMNGKHGFSNDDAWDAGSNGVGGHPPVAVITTVGCPHCKRVQEPLPRV